MTPQDQELINQSFFTDDWSTVLDLKTKAETDEAKQILGDRAKYLYRKEEYLADCL